MSEVRSNIACDLCSTLAVDASKHCSRCCTRAPRAGTHTESRPGAWLFDAVLPPSADMVDVLAQCVADAHQGGTRGSQVSRDLHSMPRTMLVGVDDNAGVHVRHAYSADWVLQQLSAEQGVTPPPRRHPSPPPRPRNAAPCDRSPMRVPNARPGV